MNQPKNAKGIWSLIVVASLGYFVDIYDLILFNVVKAESFKSLGFSADQVEDYDYYLFNWQMSGMLLGGILWGILGDRKGRIQVLFGSILMYSVANIMNAFVTGFEEYAVWRFLAGVGLAGELGAGVTLVVESMEKSKRGYGTMIIVTFGALGAVVASMVGREGKQIAAWFHLNMDAWQMAYIVGGVLGLLLLLLRAGAYESGMFKESKNSTAKRGDLLMLFNKKDRLMKYLACIAIGLPIWFVVGVLINQSHKLAEFIQVQGKVVVGESVKWTYIGLSVGDLLSGFLSQIFRTRKKIVILYLFLLTITIFLYFGMNGVSTDGFYTLCFLLGATTGYWALFVTNASEQFGTNLRSTVANTVPNMVRGATVPITLSFKMIWDQTGNPAIAAAIVGGTCMILALISAFYVKDTFHKDLNYLEH